MSTLAAMLLVNELTSFDSRLKSYDLGIQALVRERALNLKQTVQRIKQDITLAIGEGKWGIEVGSFIPMDDPSFELVRNFVSNVEPEYSYERLLEPIWHDLHLWAVNQQLEMSIELATARDGRVGYQVYVSVMC